MVNAALHMQHEHQLDHEMSLRNERDGLQPHHDGERHVDGGVCQQQVAEGADLEVGRGQGFLALGGDEGDFDRDGTGVGDCHCFGDLLMELKIFELDNGGICLYPRDDMAWPLCYLLPHLFSDLVQLLLVHTADSCAEEGRHGLVV